jgi:hypothetical protein
MNMVTGLSGTSYEEKLQDISLLLLEERHHKADIHLMHKIMHGEGDLDAHAWLRELPQLPMPLGAEQTPLMSQSRVVICT